MGPFEEVHENQPVPQQQSSAYTTLVVYAIAALAIAIIVRFFIAAPYIVSGASMEPTFHAWNYLIVDRISYQFDEPQRGEIIVFKFPYDPSRSIIKRVIGLPGETVILSEDAITIQNEQQPDGFVLDEPYIDEMNFRPANMTVTLGESEYFVLGDNRSASADSRSWGALPREFIVGRAFARLFPFEEIDIWPGNATYQEEVRTQ